jgi:hypothetical protein
LFSNETNEEPNSSLSLDSREEPSTPRELYYSPPKTPSTVFSQDSWNLPPSPAYSTIRTSPRPLQSELHHQSLHRARSSSMLGFQTSWNTYSPLNPSSPTTLYDLDPDMPDSNSEYSIPRFREPKTARLDAALQALKFLSKKKISVTELTGLILDGEGDFLGYRNTIFAENNRKPLKDVLTRILADKKGRELTRDWMLPYAVDLVCEEVHCEMEEAKPSLRMDTNEVTTEFAHSWDIDQIMGPVVEKITPTWSAILDAATESKEAKNKIKTSKSRNRRTVSNYFRSSSKAQAHLLVSRAV